MPYVAPATVVTATTITSAWGNSVKSATDYLANPPACRVFHNTTQTIVNNTATAVLFNSERFDTDNMHSTATNTSRITINTAGLYVVGANIDFGTDTDYTDIQLYLRINGATQIAFTRDVNPGAVAGARIMNLNTVYKFAVADYVEVVGLQVNTSAGTNNLDNFTNRSPEFWACWVGLG